MCTPTSTHRLKLGTSHVAKVRKLQLYGSCNDRCFRHTYNRSSRPELFLKNVVLKICSKFRGEHPC